MKKIRVAVSGAGNRACSVVRDLLEAAKGGVEIAAVYDPDVVEAKKSASTFFQSPDAKICTSWSEALDCGVDWALVISPNCFHRRQIEAARGNRIVDLRPVWEKLGC
ncbi:MAG: hypothetical protein MJ016_02895 [Victivallaceae bacterium]|nr:hypothetical protein [Victivallaceae bacterium]